MNFSGATGGIVSFAIAALLLPLLVWISARWRIYDTGGALKIHTRLTSRLGGIAIFAAILGAHILLDSRAALRAGPLSVALSIIFFAGLVDDLRGLSPYLRLALQILAASLVPLAGWRVSIAPQHAPNFFVTVFLLVTFTNAFNMFDGADGLAASVAAIIAFAYALLPGLAPVTVSEAAWIVAGACIAFLCFNFPPAIIFLGDSGSTVLGFTLGCLALDSSGAALPTPRPLLFILFATALPLLDLGFAVIRRARGRRSILFGDRSHICDLIVNRGWSTRRMALTCYGTTAALAVLGWISLRTSTTDFLAFSALTLVTLVYTGGRLGALRTSEEQNPGTAQRKVQLNRDGSNAI